MDSETSSDSGNRSPPQPLARTLETLMPLVNSLEDDINQLKTKISSKSLDPWTEIPVTPKTAALQQLWTRYGMAEGATIESFMATMFQKARQLDVTTRTIHFSVEDALTLGRNSMTIYEVLHLLADSVDLV